MEIMNIVFIESDVKILLESFEKHTVPKEPTRTLTIKETLSQCYQFGFSLADFLLFVKEKKIVPCQINNDEKGLHKFSFNMEDIRKVLLNGYLNINEISAEMNITSNSVARWVKQGFIKVSKTVGPCMQLIHPSDYMEFRKTFISAIEIIELEITPFKSTSKLIKELFKEGITPVNVKECSDDLDLLKRSEKLDDFLRINEIKDTKLKYGVVE